MFKEKVDALSQMTVEHLAMPFPPGCRSLDIEGQDMVMLDADAYGYTVSVLGGPLNEQQRASLTRMTTVFEKVLAAIEDEYATTYYTHVRDMVLLAAEVEILRQRQPPAEGLDPREKGVHWDGHLTQDSFDQTR